MTKAITRTVLLSATILGASCGAPRADVVQTGPAAADTAEADMVEADAIAAIRSLDDIPETRVCITPELCEDLRAWRPEALYVLDGHLTALGGVHAFVRMGDAWMHHALPHHTTPMSNGHALFFCDREGTVLELSSSGLRRRGTLESPECAAVVASGERLYVVRGDGPVLRQEGNGWRTLDFELRYGNGYSVNTVAMTATRAFVVNEEGDLLELPPEGSSGEPRLVAELQLGHMATMLGVPGTERIIASSGDSESSGRDPVFAIIDAVVEGGVVRRVARTLEVPGVPRREPTETGSDGSENESADEESYDEEGEELEAESEEEEDRTLDLGIEIVGLDPLLIAHRSATFDIGSRVGTISIEHFLLAEGGWTPLATAHPELSHIEVGQGAFGTDMPIRTLPIHVGPFRVVVNRYQGHVRGPIVTAWRGDGTDVALTAFDLETHSSLPAGCDEEGGTICRPLAEGQFLRAISVPPRRAVRRIELVGADGTVRLAHEAVSEIRMAELAGAERLYVAEGTRPLGFVDASGYHAISLPAGERVERIRALANGSAYVSASDDRLYFVDGASLARVEHAETFADAWLYDVGDGCVARVEEGGYVWLRGSNVARIVLDADPPPDEARSLSPEGLALAAPDGTTWLLQRGEVHVASAPAPDEAHQRAPRWFLPDPRGEVDRWSVSFERPGFSTPSYRTSPPSTLRTLGPLTAFARPYRSPLVLLARRDAELTQSESEGTPQPTSLLAYWERPENTGMRPTRWAGSVVVADPAMSTVVFLTQPLFAADSYSPPRVVARLVGGRATGASSPRDDAAAHARSLVTAEMSEADAFALNDGRAGAGDLVGIVPSGPRASELLRVRIERGRTVVLEVIDRDNSRATRVGTTTLPARSVLTFATAAVSSDGTHVALALGVRAEADEEGARATASHLVLPLPAAPSAE
ncbi:MAG: hypothetical protein J0L92_16640 [Deltaproteobacteria bacterium]|nr:hypothetical protein [Deltaproteobacteria bacterium]